jgi:hypothetical protein
VIRPAKHSLGFEIARPQSADPMQVHGKTRNQPNPDISIGGGVRSFKP